MIMFTRSCIFQVRNKGLRPARFNKHTSLGCGRPHPPRISPPIAPRYISPYFTLFQVPGPVKGHRAVPEATRNVPPPGNRLTPRSIQSGESSASYVTGVPLDRIMRLRNTSSTGFLSSTMSTPPFSLPQLHGVSLDASHEIHLHHRPVLLRRSRHPLDKLRPLPFPVRSLRLCYLYNAVLKMTYSSDCRARFPT